MKDPETPTPAAAKAGKIPASKTPASDVPASTSADSEDAGKNGKSGLWKGTAVGIGSAALVAALMYAKRRK